MVVCCWVSGSQHFEPSSKCWEPLTQQHSIISWMTGVFRNECCGNLKSHTVHHNAALYSTNIELTVKVSMFSTVLLLC